MSTLGPLFPLIHRIASRMSANRVLYAVVPILLLAGCAGPQPKPLRAVEIEVAGPLTHLQEGARHYFENAQSGTQINFRIPEWPWVKFDVFAYRVGVGDDLKQALDRLQLDFKRDLQYAAEQGLMTLEEMESEGAFSVPTHELTATGWRGRFHLKREGETKGSLAYLFYRPPFAIKVRASFTAYADQRTDKAVDEAVRELLPAMQVTAAQSCRGKSMEVLIPSDLDEQPEAIQKRTFIVAMAKAVLRSALDGCTDLELALRTTSAACEEFQALCDSPPWTSQPDAKGSE